MDFCARLNMSLCMRRNSAPEILRISLWILSFNSFHVIVSFCIHLYLWITLHLQLLYNYFHDRFLIIHKKKIKKSYTHSKQAGNCSLLANLLPIFFLDFLLLKIRNKIKDGIKKERLSYFPVLFSVKMKIKFRIAKKTAVIFTLQCYTSDAGCMNSWLLFTRGCCLYKNVKLRRNTPIFKAHRFMDFQNNFSKQIFRLHIVGH